MKRRGLILLVVLLIFIVLIIIGLFINKNQVNTKKLCFESSKKCINVETADNSSLRERGLMFRQSLDPDSGMLFVFEQEGIESFWMKNTLIPLDIIWIDKNKNIIGIDSMVPCKSDTCESYIPSAKVLYALEVSSGFTKNNNIRVGERVSF